MRVWPVIRVFYQALVDQLLDVIDQGNFSGKPRLYSVEPLDQEIWSFGLQVFPLAQSVFDPRRNLQQPLLWILLISSFFLRGDRLANIWLSNRK